VLVGVSPELSESSTPERQPSGSTEQIRRLSALTGLATSASAEDDLCVARQPLPPVAAVVGFIDCINRGDVAGLTTLMTEDHELLVLDEPRVRGRDANAAAWKGYATSFPEYVIYPHQITERNGRVAVLGHTTGSHLGLPDDEEVQLLVIWVAEVRHGALSLWRILDDSPAARYEFGLSPDRAADVQ
jgi:hypothetical protein